MILPADHPDMPWTALLLGIWIPTFYYCGFNQFIVQRTLAAKSLRQGQLGVIFAAALWLLVPFAIVIPGIIASELYGSHMAAPDQAYPMLIRNLIPAGLRGFIFAAISGAVMSSLASMLNSASTIFTMDLYRRYFRPDTSQKNLIFLGRSATIVFLVIGCLIAPVIADPKFRGVFNYIQEFQGYISPGILAAFVFGFVVPRAPALAGVTALVSSVPIYGLFHWLLGEVSFINRMAFTFLAIILLMTVITIVKPLKEPRVIPVRKNFDMTPSPLVAWLGGLVVLAVVVFFVIFR